jgi:nucleotide-binding universal stress UspA family protein
MTAHGRVGFERLVAGSTSFALAHQAACPVLVHQPFTVVAHEATGGS